MKKGLILSNEGHVLRNNRSKSMSKESKTTIRVTEITIVSSHSNGEARRAELKRATSLFLFEYLFSAQQVNQTCQ